jgi:hypothetical protein
VCVCLASHPSRRDAGPRSFRTAERSRPRTRDRDRSMPGGWSVRGIRWCGVGVEGVALPSKTEESTMT